jgi:hypothetical protein
MSPAEGAVLGPGDLYWWPYYEAGGDAQWGSPPPTASAVSVVATHLPDVRAGLAFQFADGKVHNLSQFDELNLTVDVVEGDKFELFLGRGFDVGCSYVFDKQAASNTYWSGLSSASWCIPTQCGFDLQVAGGLFLAHVPTGSPLTASLSGMSFTVRTGGAGAGSTSGLGGAIGPGHYCWFLVQWNNSSATWILPGPTSSGAHVNAKALAGAGAGIATGSIAGMAFEIPTGFRLSQYRTMVIDATVSDGTTSNPMVFKVQAVNLDQGRGWQRQGDAKRHSYRIDLTQPEYFFPQNSSSPLSLDEVSRFEIVVQASGADARIDANVQGIEFQP